MQGMQDSILHSYGTAFHGDGILRDGILQGMVSCSHSRSQKRASGFLFRTSLKRPMKEIPKKKCQLFSLSAYLHGRQWRHWSPKKKIFCTFLVVGATPKPTKKKNDEKLEEGKATLQKQRHEKHLEERATPMANFDEYSPLSRLEVPKKIRRGYPRYSVAKNQKLQKIVPVLYSFDRTCAEFSRG